MINNEHPKFIIVGAGPAGALMANYLGQAGYEVDVYEAREDMRLAGPVGGRSINLALSLRGIAALDGVGLADQVLADAVPMPGRMIHSTTGKLSFQRYGKDDTQAIHSVSRGELNVILLNAAEKHKTVRLHFNMKCIGVDLNASSVTLKNTATGQTSTASGDIVVSADGAFSAVRRAMQKLDRFDYQQDYLAHGYKELTIPSGPQGSYLIAKNALHIWPRRTFMMIALPNSDGTFTCTLFWPFDGPYSFDALQSESDVMRFFKCQFPDIVELMPTLGVDYFENPVGSLATIRCSPWYYKDRVVVLGDAAHAVVPFYGQGMNAAFEDVLVLHELMEKHKPDWQAAFSAYHACRKDDVDTLADMAIANFVEMRDRTGSRLFLAKKKGEKLLHKLFPNLYIPLYTMATFTRMSYVKAKQRAKTQDRVVGVTAVVLLVVVMAALGLLLR